MREILAKLTLGNSVFSGQIILKNGMQILAPRRVDLQQDPEWAPVMNEEGIRDTNPYDAPQFYVGLLLAPGNGPHAPPQMVKMLFDVTEVIALIPIPEDQLPKVTSDRAVATPNGNRTKGGLVLP